MKTIKKSIWLIVSLMAMLLLVACKKDDDNGPAPTPPTPPPANTAAVTLQNFTFNPATLTISAGTTVTWTNRDNETHTVTADDNSFTSPGFGINGTYSRTFTTPGTISYHCTPHPHMMGTIIVQ